MKIYTADQIKQGSREWQMLRLGIPTTSQFHRIITAAKGELSKQAEGYMCHLMAELFMGRPIEQPTTQWMDRGHDLEEEAAALYEFENDVELEKIGFVTNDAGTIGCSPDRFIKGTRRAVEIKIPKPETHARYIISGGCDDDHRVQLQGQLWVCELDFVDIVSHHSEMPQAKVRVGRDEPYILKMQQALAAFNETLAALKVKFAHLIRPPAEPTAESMAEFLTEDDVEMVIAGLKSKGDL